MFESDVISLVDSVDEPAQPLLAPWRILVVDDDEEVHMATRYALRNATLLGRPLELSHAYSAAETETLLAGKRDFALILLDVVMERPQSGLNLVRYIRHDCGMNECRVILRTGQPGFAPELEVIEEYDINDYRTKSELTQTRLLTAVITALRAYDQLRTVSESRRGLERVVDSAARFIEARALGDFAGMVIAQGGAMLDMTGSGLFCSRAAPADEDAAQSGTDLPALQVLSAHGRFATVEAWVPPLALPDEQRLPVAEALALRRNAYGTGGVALYLGDGSTDAALYLHVGRSMRDFERQLVEVFSASVTACFRNLQLIDKLDRLAYLDPLTGLANRARHIQDIGDLLPAAQPVDLVLLDVRRFSELNNGLGQDVGNELLRVIATELRQCFPPPARLARLGADLFGVVGPSSAVQVETALARFRSPLTVGEHRLSVSFALGSYRLNGHDGTAVGALRRCSIALAEAKHKEAAAVVAFVQAMEAQTEQRLTILRHLRGEIVRGKLEMWYQPQIRLSDGAVVGMEALMRWPDGKGGMAYPPDVFIPLAEQSGLIDLLGRWALRQSLTDWRLLNASGLAPARVSVNVSMPQFLGGQLLADVAELLQELDLPPQVLELEITESVAMREPELVIETLHAFRALGVRIALDDFGTGYSSLSRLSTLPIDCLKIDRAFVAMTGQTVGDGFVEAVVALGKRIDLEIVAEGVETATQRDFLALRHCDIGQGWLFARALRPGDLKDWLALRAGSIAGPTGDLPGATSAPLLPGAVLNPRAATAPTLAAGTA